MMTRPFLVLFLFASMSAFSSTYAQTTSSGAAISGAISGNTIKGTMAASGNFEEFFASDGQIRSNGYSGTWQIDGQRLCLSYDGDPVSCWELIIDGSNVTWIGRYGEEGSGTILPGNPRGF